MFCTYETVFFKKLFKHSILIPIQKKTFECKFAMESFSSIQNFNYIGRILYEINAADIKKHPKTLLELKFKYFWV